MYFDNTHLLPIPPPRALPASLPTQLYVVCPSYPFCAGQLLLDVGPILKYGQYDRIIL